MLCGSVLPRVWACPLLKAGDRDGIRGNSQPTGSFCLPGSAEGLRWQPLSGIEKPGSGTEPIHQEHVMCSRFRGSCPSDVKSAVHPEPGFSIPPSGCSAALCAPRVTPKNPASGNIPEYHPRPRPKATGIPRPGEESKNPARSVLSRICPGASGQASSLSSVGAAIRKGQ